MTNKMLDYETRAGEPIIFGRWMIIPFARPLRIQAPRSLVGLIWNRPSSVTVISAGGQEQVLPVPDVTRQIQIALLGAGIIGSILIWSMFQRIHKGRN
jgi:hypothetical protein